MNDIELALDQLRGLAKHGSHDQRDVEQQILMAAERLLRYFKFNSFLQPEEYELLKRFNAKWTHDRVIRDKALGDEEDLDILDVEIVSARNVDDRLALPAGKASGGMTSPRPVGASGISAGCYA